MFDLGTVPFPLLSPDSDDFGGRGLMCDLSIRHFDPVNVTAEFAYQFLTADLPEQNYFKTLCQEGKAERVILIESPESLYRESETVAEEGFITRSEGILYGRVTLTPLVTTRIKLEDFNPPGRDSEWGEGPFLVGKSEIIALGDSVRVDISHKLSRRRSMIDLQLSNDMATEVYKIDASGDVIVVNAGPDIRRAIEIMSKDPSHKPALFMSLYKDVLQEGLRQAKETGGEQMWLRSLEHHLGIEDINNLSEDEMWELPMKHLFPYGAKKILVNAENV
jgi:hypothetical protein